MTDETKATVGLVVAVVCMVVLWLLLAWIKPALAQAHHRPQDQAIHEKFYKHWMMPDNRNVSCCHEEDCKPAEAHKIGNDWYARQEGDQKEFTKVPPNKVDLGLPDSPDNPDGRNHLCGRRYGFSAGEFTVFCFQPAAGY